MVAMLWYCCCAGGPSAGVPVFVNDGAVATLNDVSWLMLWLRRRCRAAGFGAR